MLRPLLFRAVAGVAVVWGVVTLVFLLLHAAPGDPATLLVGSAATPAQIAEQRHALGLDRPLPVQYAVWLARFARGDWGTSIATGRPVRAMLAGAWPATARLVLLSLLLSYALGVALGVVQARYGGTRLDTALSAASVTLFALPGYWLGLMLIVLLTLLLVLCRGSSLIPLTSMRAHVSYGVLAVIGLGLTLGSGLLFGGMLAAVVAGALVVAILVSLVTAA